jgi:hypothetical protein
MVKMFRGLAAFLLCTTLAHASFAVPPPNQVSLNTCQKVVKIEATKFVRAEILAMATCLQKISTALIRNGGTIPDNTVARTCITQFRKLNDTRAAGKSLVEKLTANVRKKCDPTFNPLLTHTVDDVTGKGSPTVPQSIQTQRLDLWCQEFGLLGPIGTVQDWIQCIAAAHKCEAEQAIAEQYPRASEWLSAVKPVMLGIAPPASDPNKTSDAVAGLTAIDSAIDSDNDNVPDITCPQAAAPPSCSTACCYTEANFGAFNPTSCVQYKGSGAQIAAFSANCTGRQSSPVGFWNLSATAGACSAGPTYGTACVVGVGNNAVQVPTDSACP